MVYFWTYAHPLYNHVVLTAVVGPMHCRSDGHVKNSILVHPTYFKLSLGHVSRSDGHFSQVGWALLFLSRFLKVFRQLFGGFKVLHRNSEIENVIKPYSLTSKGRWIFLFHFWVCIFCNILRILKNLTRLEISTILDQFLQFLDLILQIRIRLDQIPFRSECSYQIRFLNSSDT